MIDGINATTQVIIGVCTALALLAAVWAGVRRWRKATQRWAREGVAVRDAILGRDAIVDTITGKEIAPALPGIGQRMATVEDALISLANTHHRLDAVEQTQESHAKQIAANASDIADLQAQTVERIVSRQESANAYRAMEAAYRADPDQDA